MELLEILELQNSNEIISSDFSCDVIPDKGLKDFCSDTVFNLSVSVLSESEIKVLGVRFCTISKDGE